MQLRNYATVSAILPLLRDRLDITNFEMALRLTKANYVCLANSDTIQRRQMSDLTMMMQDDRLMSLFVWPTRMYEARVAHTRLTVRNLHS
jgi:hypothetical protein